MSNYKGPYNSFSQNAEPTYNQNNILGTVSQSDGVPTGAIIQRGSNANGEFVRYADGTQICTFFTPITIDIESGEGYRGLTQAFTYPASFVASPTFSSNANDSSCWASGATSILSNSVTVRAYSFLNGRTFNVSCTVIGRWY